MQIPFQTVCLIAHEIIILGPHFSEPQLMMGGRVGRRSDDASLLYGWIHGLTGARSPAKLMGRRYNAKKLSSLVRTCHSAPSKQPAHTHNSAHEWFLLLCRACGPTREDEEGITGVVDKDQRTRLYCSQCVRECISTMGYST